ncbi:FliO/MopB family protein [Schlesneria paludicola]|uniref:FliO/MopB family protein n=1 Tax=Schlesneria paludicola TaxID=360056 RepID=UPI00029AD9DB|nr:flagellar biosynthetic protein FliO [Schlesneria paludicola]
MFRFPTGIRIVVIATTLVLSCFEQMFAADPSVVRASRQIAQSDPPVEELPDSNDDPAVNKGDLASYSPNWPEPPNTGAMLLRLGIGTVIVLALCVGSLWFGKPWLQRLQVVGVNSSAFRIEGSVALGQRAMLHLVRVGDTQLVAGTDATGLKSLIALPLSFKDVLGEQVPDAEIPAAPVVPPVAVAARPFDTRVLFRPTGKE